MSKLERLASLALDACHRITDAGLAHVSKLECLSALGLSGYCGQITDAGLAHVSKLVRLATLDLAGCDQITDAGLALVASLERLAAWPR